MTRFSPRNSLSCLAALVLGCLAACAPSKTGDIGFTASAITYGINYDGGGGGGYGGGVLPYERYYAAHLARVDRLEEYYTRGGVLRRGTGAPLSGYERVRFGDGSYCDCQWRDGQPTDGTIHYADGGTYDGELYNMRPNGLGELKLPDGTKYYGQFLAGKYDGQGKLRLPDSTVIEGEFDDGEPHGKASYHAPDRNIIFEGHFERGEPRRGALSLPLDGHIVWMNGKYERVPGNDNPWALRIVGDGTYITRRAGEYYGGFFNGLFEGWGLGAYISDQGHSYVGPWRQGVPSGEGGMMILSRDISRVLREGSRIFGTFVDGRPVGKVVVSVPDRGDFEAYTLEDGYFTRDHTRFFEADVLEDGSIMEIPGTSRQGHDAFANPAAIVRLPDRTFYLSPEGLENLKELREMLEHARQLEWALAAAPTFMAFYNQLPKGPPQPTALGKFADQGADTVLEISLPNNALAAVEAMKRLPQFVRNRLRGQIYTYYLASRNSFASDRSFWYYLAEELELGRLR